MNAVLAPTKRAMTDKHHLPSIRQRVMIAAASAMCPSSSCSECLKASGRAAAACRLSDEPIVRLSDRAGMGPRGLLETGRPPQDRGESKRLVAESPWSLFTSECQRF
eukprot:COSAG01_NODE_2126_length_8367_cov_3.977866_13_plen_107_part_00